MQHLEAVSCRARCECSRIVCMCCASVRIEFNSSANIILWGKMYGNAATIKIPSACILMIHKRNELIWQFDWISSAVRIIIITRINYPLILFGKYLDKAQLIPKMVSKARTHFAYSPEIEIVGIFRVPSNHLCGNLWGLNSVFLIWCYIFIQMAMVLSPQHDGRTPSPRIRITVYLPKMFSAMRICSQIRTTT